MHLSREVDEFLSNLRLAPGDVLSRDGVDQRTRLVWMLMLTLMSSKSAHLVDSVMVRFVFPRTDPLNYY